MAKGTPGRTVLTPIAMLVGQLGQELSAGQRERLEARAEAYAERAMEGGELPGVDVVDVQTMEAVKHRIMAAYVIGYAACVDDQGTRRRRR